MTTDARMLESTAMSVSKTGGQLLLTELNTGHVLSLNVELNNRAPSVTLQAPALGFPLYGTITFSGVAVDPDGNTISSLTYSLDNAAPVALPVNGTANLPFSFNLTPPHGDHTLTFYVTDQYNAENLNAFSFHVVAPEDVAVAITPSPAQMPAPLTMQVSTGIPGSAFTNSNDSSGTIVFPNGNLDAYGTTSLTSANVYPRYQVPGVRTFNFSFYGGVTRQVLVSLTDPSYSVGQSATSIGSGSQVSFPIYNLVTYDLVEINTGSGWETIASLFNVNGVQNGSHMYVSQVNGSQINCTSLPLTQTPGTSANYTYQFRFNGRANINKSFTVVGPPVAVSSMTINGPSQVNDNVTTQYSATLYYNNGTSTTTTAVNWSSSIGSIPGGAFSPGVQTGGNVAATLYASVDDPNSGHISTAKGVTVIQTQVLNPALKITLGTSNPDTINGVLYPVAYPVYMTYSGYYSQQYPLHITNSAYWCPVNQNFIQNPGTDSDQVFNGPGGTVQIGTIACPTGNTTTQSYSVAATDTTYGKSSSVVVANPYYNSGGKNGGSGGGADGEGKGKG